MNGDRGDPVEFFLFVEEGLASAFGPKFWENGDGGCANRDGS